MRDIQAMLIAYQEWFSNRVKSTSTIFYLIKKEELSYSIMKSFKPYQQGHNFKMVMSVTLLKVKVTQMISFKCFKLLTGNPDIFFLIL